MESGRAFVGLRVGQNDGMLAADVSSTSDVHFEPFVDFVDRQ